MPESYLRKKFFLRTILFLVPVLLYFNTILNDYALDDSIVITQNIYVKKGLKGIKEIFRTETFTGFFKKKKDLVQGGRYRPLSVASFAVENALWGERPGLSHLINALLYGILCVILFELLCALINNLDSTVRNIPVAFIATLIFAVHPVHTEVVANIKGRDELFTGLFFLLSFRYLVKSYENASLCNAIASGIFLFLALLSKENAIALIPCAVLFYIMKEGKKDIKTVTTGLAFLFAGASAYLLIRYSVIGGVAGGASGELMNNPFLDAQNGEKIPTIFYTLLIYIKLLFVPYPLTYDYYPYHIALQHWSAPLVIISLLLNLLIFLTGIYYFRKNKVMAIGIFIYFILLLPVSNLLVNIGSFMNERFLFLPSIGFALVAGYIFNNLLFYKAGKFILNKKVSVFFALVLLIFCLLTVKRNTVWKDNLTLFTHDVNVSSESAKGNCAAGGILYETAIKENPPIQKKEMLNQSIQYLEKALSIYPKYIDALLLLGNAHFEQNKDMPKVFEYYSQILNKAPGYDLAYQNLNKMLSALSDPSARIAGYNLILSYRPGDFDANYLLGVTYGKMLNRLDSAIFYLSRALKIQPDSKLANRDLGVAYAMNGNFPESLPLFEKVVRMEPDDPGNYINLGITCQKLGKADQANAMFLKAEELKKKIAP